MKKKIAFFSAVAVALTAIALQMRTYQKSEFLLDTYITMSARGFGARSAVNEAFDEIKNFEEKNSVYRKNSALSKLNENGFATLDFETVALIKNAKIYSEKTSGAFDVTLKPLSDLWNIKNFSAVPSDDEIAAVMPKVGSENIEISQNNVTLKNGAELDLGGIAKGFLTDKCILIMQKHKVKSAILNLGGNIYAYETGKKSVKIGLQNPNGERGEYFGFIEGKNISVVTSGGYERFAEYDGKKYSHIINPFDGKCADSEVISASVIGKSSEKCDAFATAICVLGVEEGLEIINAESGLECVIVDKNNRVYLSNGAEFKITDEKFTRGN